MLRKDNLYRKQISHVRDRVNEPPRQNDIRSIKLGFIDWIIHSEAFIDELVPSVKVMKSCLGYIMLIDDNWTSLNLDDINTGRVFFKHMFDLIDA